MRFLSLVLLLLVLGCAACAIAKSAKIEKAVLDALAADSRTASYKFEVSCDDAGVVLITGELYAPHEFDAVTEIASAVPGVTAVTNNCKLEEQGSGMIQDETVPSPFL